MSSCSDAQLRDLDLYYWRQSLIGSAASGAGATLQNPTGCIIKGASNALTVSIFWAGRESSHDGANGVASTITTACGIAGVDLTRRQFVLMTTL